MTENNQFNKDKFFAIYYGQEVAVYYPNKEVTNRVHFFGYTRDNTYDYLKLKPLSSISDVDAIEVAKIWRRNNEVDFSIETAKTIVGRILEFSYNAYHPVLISQKIIDYLRSKGYLFPYLDLDTEKIINYGWAKID